MGMEGQKVVVSRTIRKGVVWKRPEEMSSDFLCQECRPLSLSLPFSVHLIPTVCIIANIKIIYLDR